MISVDGTTVLALPRGKARIATWRAATTRFYVSLLVIASVVATLAMAIFLLLYQAAVQRDEIEQQAAALAQSMAVGIDRQLGAAEALLTGLAASHYLDTGDLAAFHDQAARVAKPPGSWIFLLNPEGRMLVNEKRPYGAPLPELAEDRKRVIATIVATRSTRVTNLIQAQVTDDQGAALAIPVIRDGEVIYALAIALVGPALTRGLDQRVLPAGWSGAVLDRLGATLMRYPNDGPAFDAVTASALLDRIHQDGGHGFGITLTTDQSVFIAHAVSGLSGWTTIVTVPDAILARPTHRAVLLLGCGGGVVLLLAAGAALFAGRRIELPFREHMEASEGRFRTMAETVPDILFTVGAAGQCEYVNPRFYEYTGMAAGSALGDGWILALHPDDRPLARGSSSWPTKEGDLILNEVRFRATDGNYRWFLSRLRAVRDGGGRIVRWFGSANDIDDLKQSGAVMRRINDRLMAVLSSIDECYYTVDHDWRITYVNPKAATYFRKDPKRLVGRTLWEVSPHLIGTELEQQLRAALEGHTPLRVERRSREYPGCWFVISCYPWAEGLSIFFRDISRRKGAELAARDNHERLQLTMDALSAHIVIIDARGTIIGANAAWLRFGKERGFGDAPYEIGADYLALCVAAIAGASHRKQLTNGVRRILRGEQPAFRMEYASATPNAPKWFQIRATRLGDGAGAVVAHEDVTEIKEAENGLRQLTGRLLRLQDEERRRMARDLHDITSQNLVAAALDIDRACKALSGPDHPTKEPLEEARGLVEQALQEIRTLSYLLHPPLLDELGLGAALGWYVRGFERRSGITVALTVPEKMERLPAAAERALFRVVQESLTNIHRHSGSATAEIRLSSSGSEIVLEVSDQGRGMPDTVNRDRAGIVSLGVGVSGMRVRLNQLGGQLSVRGTAQGTTVRATISLDRLDSISAVE